MHAVSSGPDLTSLICEGVRSCGILCCCWQLHNMIILWIMNFAYQISLSNIPFLHQNKMDLCLDFEI